MSYTNVVPNRELRLNATVAYGGDCSCLANERRQGCLKRRARTFSQASVCQEWYSMFTLLTVENSAVIVHGPVGCVSSAATMNIFNRLGQAARGTSPIRSKRWFSTELGENEVIHGGEDKLRGTVRAVDERYHPEVIFVFTSCVSGIIGDAVRDVINALQSEVGARIVLSECEGFKSSVWATGFDAAFHGITQALLEPRNERIANLVNVISPLTVGRLDEVEIERLFESLGLRANFIPCYASLEGIRKTVQASATVSTCMTYGDYFARQLEEHYGVPFTRDVMPLGIESTDAWLRNLAPLVGKEQQVERLIAAEHARIKPTVESLRSKLAGKRVFVSAGQARAMTMSALATELGFELVGTTVYHYDEVIVESIARLSRSLGNFPINVANVQPFEQANLLRRLKPDLYLSDEMTTGWAAKQGIPTMMIYDYGMTYLGYEGVLKIGERILHSISNPSFSLGLQRHKSLPYRESWYSADPFKHVALDGVE